MTTISVVPVAWNGSPVVGGGVSVLHSTAGDEHALMVAFRAMFSTAAAAFPDQLQLSFPAAGVQINDANGDVVGSWNDATPVATITGGTGSAWVNGVGARVKWSTGDVHDGRFVVGSTFLVPLINGVYEGAGNLLGSTVTLLQGAATTFVGTGHLLIWARPKPTVPGASFVADGANVPDRVSWLRGRRT